MIPFTQYMRPHGRREPVEIAMPEELERLARALLNVGAIFEVEVLQTSHVSLECICGRDEDRDPIVLAHELCANGPAVPVAVDKLVRDAYAAKFGGLPA